MQPPGSHLPENTGIFRAASPLGSHVANSFYKQTSRSSTFSDEFIQNRPTTKRIETKFEFTEFEDTSAADIPGRRFLLYDPLKILGG